MRLGAIVVAIIVAAWWIIEVLDTLVLDDTLQANGIRPRKSRGLDGILWMPFLHSDFGHVISNTFPFVVLSALVMIRGVGRWGFIVALGWLGGGLLTWLFAGGGNHIGASGVVFALFGALLGAAAFERSAAAMAPALVTLLLYTTMLVGLVPQDRISWEGHLAGFAVGIASSKLLARPRRRRDVEAEEAEIDRRYGGRQPWLEVEAPE